MVAIRPFCALRYNPEQVNDLGTVIAPPYDIISPIEQAQLYDRSPYNIVRLILGKQFPHDTEQDNRYTRARGDFMAWREHQILVADPTPAYYLISHAFQAEGRRRTRVGFVALFELEDAAAQQVYRHEATLEAPKADRTKLLDAVPANLSPIFCVYPDEGGALQAWLGTLTGQSPPMVRATMKGEELAMWRITEPEAVRRISSALASRAVLIADGHHRFEVAYARRHHEGLLMSYFVSMADPALAVRPIHRLVPRGASAILDTLRNLCTMAPASHLESLVGWLQSTTDEGCFGYADGHGLYRVQIKAEVMARWLMAPAVPRPLAALDVSLLHHVVLPGLGMPSGGVRYTADAAEALQMANGAGGASAWLLRGIPVSQVYALAAQGLTLPPKSTYFTPKVPSGLTINPFH